MLNRATYGYSYCGINTGTLPQVVDLNLSDSKNMICTPRSGKVTKIIQPGAIEFLMHVEADPREDTFIPRERMSAREI